MNNEWKYFRVLRARLRTVQFAWLDPVEMVPRSTAETQPPDLEFAAAIRADFSEMQVHARTEMWRILEPVYGERELQETMMAGARRFFEETKREHFKSRRRSFIDFGRTIGPVPEFTMADVQEMQMRFGREIQDAIHHFGQEILGHFTVEEIPVRRGERDEIPLRFADSRCGFTARQLEDSWPRVLARMEILRNQPPSDGSQVKTLDHDLGHHRMRTSHDDAADPFLKAAHKIATDMRNRKMPEAEICRFLKSLKLPENV